MSPLLAGLLLPLITSTALAGDLTLHEWGTFTAVAGADGRVVDWRPLSGPSDLPSFVYDSTSPLGDSLRSWPPVNKLATAPVRMETPVIYFYADEAMDVSLAVNFPEGAITEWYPQAASYSPKRLDWGTFRIDPALDADLPKESSPSHYYPAREVKAATVRVCDDQGAEAERFLFYRGIGSMELDLHAELTDAGVKLSHPHGKEVRALIFENRDGEMGFSAAEVSVDGTVVARPERKAGAMKALPALGEHLAAAGLYPDEVAAMLKTWEDSWLEPGLRVFALLPSAEVEVMLPLEVEPAPTSSVRVMVARIEVITPEDLADAEALLAKADASATLEARFGRLAEPVLRRLAESKPTLASTVAPLLPSDD